MSDIYSASSSRRPSFPPPETSFQHQQHTGSANSTYTNDNNPFNSTPPSPTLSQHRNSIAKQPLSSSPPRTPSKIALAPPKYSEANMEGFSEGSQSHASTSGMHSISMDNQISLTRLQNLKKDEMVVECPQCGKQGMSRGKFVAGRGAHVSASVMFMMLCCWIPYVTNVLKDVEHRCGDCGVLLATWRRGSNGTTVHVKGHSGGY